MMLTVTDKFRVGLKVESSSDALEIIHIVWSSVRRFHKLKAINVS